MNTFVELDHVHIWKVLIPNKSIVKDSIIKLYESNFIIKNTILADGHAKHGGAISSLRSPKNKINLIENTTF